MLLVLLWILFGIAGAVIGKEKDAGGSGFCLGILLGPIGLLIAIFMRGNRIRCAFCHELMKPQATVCPHCQREQPATAISQQQHHERTLEAEQKRQMDELEKRTRLF